jgi:CRP/FNR family transcriptional regulator, cyclic AMP receptor protein
VIAVIDLFRHSRSSRPFKPGDVFFREGDDGGCLFVLLDGAVEIRKDNRVLELVGAGEVFGEMELVEHEPRWASAVAVSDGTVVTVTEKQFNFLVANTPHFATEMIRLVAERLRRTYAA